MAKQFETLLVRAQGERKSRVIEHFAQVETGGFQFELARLDLGKVEDVVDDGKQLRGGLAHGFEQIALLRGQIGFQRQGCHADHAVHRRADLMAHVREELALGLAGGLGSHGHLIRPLDGGLELPVGLAEFPVGGLGLLLGLAQFLLHPLAFGDVHHRADHADGLAFRITDHVAAVKDECECSVHPPETVFGGPKTFPGLDAPLDVVPRQLPVVGMQTIGPGFKPRLEFAGLVAKESEERLVPPERVRGDVPVPNRVIGGVGDELEALLTFAQRRLGAFPLRDLLLQHFVGAGQFGRARFHTRLEFIMRGPQLGLALLDVFEHRVEGIRQQPQFIVAAFDGANGVILLRGHVAHGVDQLEDRFGDETLQPGGEQQGDEPGHHEDTSHDRSVLFQPRVECLQVGPDVNGPDARAAMHHRPEQREVVSFVAVPAGFERRR